MSRKGSDPSGSAARRSIPPRSRRAGATPPPPPGDAGPDEAAGKGRSGGFEGFLSGLSGLLGTLSHLAEKGEQLRREGGFRTRDGRDVKFHYGVSVRTMNGGRDLKVEPFGNLNPERKAASPVAEVREPLTDIFEEDDHILVVAEMPGVAEKDISAQVEGDILTIEASRKDKRYRKEVLLPGTVAAGKVGVRCNNGVVEIRCGR